MIKGLASHEGRATAPEPVVRRVNFQARPNIKHNEPKLSADDLSDFRYRLSAIRSVVDGLIERMDALK
ncbi:hypothetical protein SAMN04488135_101230 [Pollutimonas bauzanensis]|uniref:Uncharacterized protein n=1 Tax=Pollutimonas bauzanensis TaxID=658167 RepID=A0A1M5MHY2_9BURK|nr:hypothetical protein SAMN04488135_101230 [Pollutimonas bauzanensis]